MSVMERECNLSDDGGVDISFFPLSRRSLRYRVHHRPRGNWELLGAKKLEAASSRVKAQSS